MIGQIAINKDTKVSTNDIYKYIDVDIDIDT